MKRLQDQDDEDIRREKARNSWYTYLTSPFYGKAVETEEEKQQRENERLRRLAIRSIKKHELSGLETKRRGLQSALEEVKIKITSERQKIENVARERELKRQEQLRKEREAKRQEEVERQAREWRAAREKMQAEMRREEAVRAAKRAKEAKEAQEAREARARMQAAQEAREAQIRAQAAREAEAERQRVKSRHTASAASYSNHRRVPTFEDSKSTACGHRAFWPKLEGSHLCSNCQTIQRRFAFQCPGCKMVACADCRQILRGEKPRHNKNSKRSSGHHQYHQSDDVPLIWDDMDYD